MKNLLIGIFTEEDKSYTLIEIKKLLSTKLKSPINMQELIATLKRLELDEKIYYNEEAKQYCNFPSNFFVTKITNIDRNANVVSIKHNGMHITLPMPSEEIKSNQRVLIKISKKGKFIITRVYEEVNSNDLYKDDLLNIFYPLANGLSFKEIEKIIKQKDSNVDSNEIRKILDNLEQEGLIYFDEYKLRYYNVTKELLRLQVESTKKGKLFVTINNNQVILPKHLVNDLLPNDIVLLKIDKDNCELVKIICRGNPKVICEIENGNVKIVGNSKIKVKMNKKDLEALGYPDGTRFVANISKTGFNHVYDVTHIEYFGHKNDLNSELYAIAYNNGFLIHYTEEELSQINKMPTEVTEEDKKNRIDLTDECIFTIDGSHTKDMDDAVSVKFLDNGNYELTVSIAAVNHYIKFGSPLWRRAEQNTTSVYMIDSVDHMLHPKVSNGICSLNPGFERLAKSFRMKIDKNGNIYDIEILDTVIKSRKKMTYEDVNKILEEGIVPEGYEDYVFELLKMKELSDILSEKHKRDGSLDFDGKEIRFILDDEQNIVDIETIKQGSSQKIIENFMVATNEAVAEFMLNLGITFIYRNHKVPLNIKVLQTTELIKSLGYRVEKIRNANDPRLIQKIIQSLNTKEEFLVLSTLLLRSMQKAYFSTENKGHYALALKAYSQVTSPIRRFLDLLIQYILDNLDNLYDPSFDFEELKEYMAQMCQRASMMERNAEKAEYEANKLYMVNYCADRPDQQYTAFIQDITPRFMVVKTKELIEGFVFFEDINDGRYVYNPNSKTLEHRKTKERITIGTKVFLTLKHYDKEFRNIYFQGTTLEQELNLERKKN